MRFLFILLLAILSLIGCRNQESIKVGFIGSLSGRASSVSQSARNGIILAFDELNRVGGIKGRHIEVVFFDDKSNPETAAEGVKSLSDQGVSLILGPILSEMSLAATPVASALKVPLISPTSSTEELTGIKDYFFRTIPPSSQNAKLLADYASENLGFKNVAIIYDLSNKGFTAPWQKSFSEQMEMRGGKVVKKLSYSSLDNKMSFGAMAKELLLSQPDTVLVLANSLDTALICQHIHMRNEKMVLLGSDWAFGGNVSGYAGHGLDGYVFTTSLPVNEPSRQFQKFESNYIEKYGSPPLFPATLGYEAAQFVIVALMNNQATDITAETFLGLGPIEILQGHIQLDDYGDCKRKAYINKIVNGKVMTLRETH